MTDFDLSALDNIHKLMGIKTPFQEILESVNGVNLEEDGSNLLFKNGGIFIIDPVTGQEFQATIHIKKNDGLKVGDFEKIFKENPLLRRLKKSGLGMVKDSRRIHLTKCITIVKMIEKKEFWKYHGSQKNSHIRRVLPRGNMESDEPLLTCWNCITGLGLRRQDIRTDMNNFDFESFFKLGIGHIPEAEQSETAPADSTPDDWEKIKKESRRKAGWACECCGVNLSGKNKEYLHTHHINKRTSDCRPENLMVLCKLCHSGQPHHGHMAVDSPFLRDLRVKQGILRDCRACGK